MSEVAQTLTPLQEFQRDLAAEFPDLAAEFPDLGTTFPHRDDAVPGRDLVSRLRDRRQRADIDFIEVVRENLPAFRSEESSMYRHTTALEEALAKRDRRRELYSRAIGLLHG